MGKWLIPKEEWENRTCLFCNMEMVETEGHFIMECLAYNEIRSGYVDILEEGNLNYLFEEKKLGRSANRMIKIHCQRADVN